MLAPFESSHWTDAAGNPGGGCSHGTGFCISWQNGPLGPPEARIAPNGAFVETIVAAARDRIQHYQESRFACDENAEAIEHLTKALEAMNRRTARRTQQGVEGTHKGD